MTGIERLRELAEGVNNGWMVVISPLHVKGIADQIEREHVQTCEDHEKQQQIIRDLQRERDEALRDRKNLVHERDVYEKYFEWVQEHGGVNLIELHEEAFNDLKGERDRYRECARMLDRVNVLVNPGEEGVRDFEYGDTARETFKLMMGELERRLMPPGMEWPRYEEGKKLNLGDPIMNDDELPSWREVDSVTFHRIDGDCAVDIENVRGVCERYRTGERVKRPQQDPIGADGLPIKKGETVFGTETGCELIVDGFVEDGSHGPYTVDCHLENGGEQGYYMPNKLAHTNPEPADSWEQIEKDCGMCDVDYCDRYGLLDKTCNAAEGDGSTRHCTTCACTCGEKMARDLVRRAKALAERGKDK